MPDKTITCKDCGTPFVFTESEQAFYREKGFDNDPQRCADCRSVRKQQRLSRRVDGPREMFPAVCSNCGVQTEVPFQPNPDKPVYCKDCYQARGR